MSRRRSDRIVHKCGMVYKAYREGRAEGVERRRIADAK